MVKRLAALGLLVLLLNEAGLARDWKVFCLPEKHLDVGWSHLPAEVLDQGYPGSVEEYQVFSLARALFVRGLTTDASRTGKYPPDAQYRWFVDAAWQMEQLEKYRPDLFPRLRQLINEGAFSYNPIYANLHTLALSHEQMMRMMAHGRVLEDKGFRRSFVASAGDVFSVGWGYSSTLASAGIKYFIKGTYYTGPSVTPGITLIQPAPLFRWVGPDGKKVLCFYYDSYMVMAGGSGKPGGEPLSAETIEKNVKKYEALNREGKWPYDAFPMFGSEGDWGIPDKDDSDFIREWDKSHPDVRLIMSTPEEFFEYMESNFGDKIPDGVSGGWGVSHDVEETTFVKPVARARANDHLLLAAEAFGSIAALRHQTEYPGESVRQAWLKQALFHEHSFGYLGTGPSPESRRQYAWKNRLTEQAADVARAALNPALKAIAARLSNEGQERVAVFNSLAFPHTDLVELPLDGKTAQQPVKVVDVESNREAPSQVVEIGGQKKLRFPALAVPAVGYKSFRIERGGAPSPAQAQAATVKADAQARTLENQFYRLALTPEGSVASLFDKEQKQEIFETGGPYQGNQFIFKDDDWRDHSPASAVITVENQGAVSATLKVVSAPLGIFPRMTRRYSLYDGLKRLDIENSFTKEPGKTDSAETVFYAFPFAVAGGAFRIDIPGVVARYPEEFRQETEWTYMPAQSFVNVSNERVSALLATREAPNFAFRSMRKFFEHRPLPDLANATVFAMPLTKQSVNKHDFDFEGGAYEFHYALTSGPAPFRAADAVRFGWGFQRGFQVLPIENPKGSLPATKSFLRMDGEGVLLSPLKPADDGRGFIVRLWNPGSQPATGRISLPDVRIAAALRTDLMERDTGGEYERSSDGIIVPCGAREWVTVRLLVSKPVP